MATTKITIEITITKDGQPDDDTAGVIAQTWAGVVDALAQIKAAHSTLSAIDERTRNMETSQEHLEREAQESGIKIDEFIALVQTNFAELQAKIASLLGGVPNDIARNVAAALDGHQQKLEQAKSIFAPAPAPEPVPAPPPAGGDGTETPPPAGEEPPVPAS